MTMAQDEKATPEKSGKKNYSRRDFLTRRFKYKPIPKSFGAPKAKTNHE